MNILKFAAVGFCMAAQLLSAQFKQTPLPYAYNALEPFVDAETMEIHYSKHGAGYTSNLNKAIAGTAMEKESLKSILSHISKENSAVRNNAGGHYNHELFWTVLTPNKNTQPSAKLLAAINEAFGSMDNFKKEMSDAGAKRFGSGWAWLIVTPEKKLAITSTANQDNPLMDIAEVKGTPIFGIDVWEHAYYLKYQNKRADYLSAIWAVTNWDEISQRYILATEGRFASWPELKSFHKVMAATFHPSEKGDLQPIKTQVSDLAAKAKALKSAKIPAEFNKKGISESLITLQKQTDNLRKKIKRSSDAKITKDLSEIHDTFHTIVGLCIAEDGH